MGSKCEFVPMQTSGNEDVAVGKWKNSRLGLMRGFSTELYAFSITVYGDKNVFHSQGEPEGYASLLRQITKLCKAGVPPVSPEESLEVIAFMEAAALSNARGELRCH